MNDMKLNRRNFLRMLGWGGAGTALTACDLPTTITLEEGKEEVVSYFMPEEYVIPGIGVWYASTCTQCEAACGLHARVREGRPLKLEGNPDSPINAGKTCMMGQAGVQAHYNPDRITAPMMRKGGSLQTVSWDEAWQALSNKLASTGSNRFAMMSGTLSGHQLVLAENLLTNMGSANNHYVHEFVNTNVWQRVSEDMLGDYLPKLRFDKAQVILSFGADFLGAWMSPVTMAAEYAKFRSPSRGVLVQVEPKMTLTGANADLWLAANPGTEGALALGIANFIVNRGWNKVAVPASVAQDLKAYDLDTVEAVTGIPVSRIKRIASLLSERAPALVLAGSSAYGHEKGYEAASAAMLLNIIMGAVGETLEPSSRFPERNMRAKQGGTADLFRFVDDARAKKYDMLVYTGTNPLYSTPDSVGMQEAFDAIGFKVALSTLPDESTMAADLVIPLSSALEDWGTHVAAYNLDEPVLSFQQPLTEPLYKDTKGLGDVLLGMLKVKNSKYGKFSDYYQYLQAAVVNMPGVNKDAWNGILQKGLIAAKGASPRLQPKTKALDVAKAYGEDKEYPFILVPSARLGLWDGRHANIPWLQEAPDQISKVVWDSWAEMHPRLADQLGVHSGDIIRIKSENGSIETQVYVHKGVHPQVVAVPIGQGHTAMGRYAKNGSANPIKILSASRDNRTGELASHSTRVSVAKVDRKNTLVKMGASETQMGRQFVKTIPADIQRRTEKEA